MWVGSSGAKAALVAYWSLDESGGMTAQDDIGTVDGVLSGGAAFVPGAGILGGAVELPDTSNLPDPYHALVNFGDHFAFQGSAFSVVAWTKTIPGTTASTHPVGKHEAGAGSGYFLGINDNLDGIGPEGESKAHFNVDDRLSGASTTVVNDGHWHQLVGVFDPGAGRVSIYVDGELESSGAPAGSIETNSVPFLVGGVTFADPTQTFVGMVDEVRIYDNALSDDDVRTLYMQTVPGDVNFDGVVDIFDVNLISAHWGEAGPTADANGDGIVDIFDVNMVSANWSGGGGATAVPEPSTLVLMAAAGVVLAFCWRNNPSR